MNGWLHGKVDGRSNIALFTTQYYYGYYIADDRVLAAVFRG